MTNDPHSPDSPDHENTNPNVEEPPVEDSVPHEDKAADAARKVDDFAKSVEDALRNGARDARKAFDTALPKAKEDLNKGVHDLAYALAYATAFGGALLKEVTPDVLSEGLREGMAAGQKAASDVIRERKERSERKAREAEAPDSPDSDEPGPSEPVMV